MSPADARAAVTLREVERMFAENHVLELNQANMREKALAARIAALEKMAEKPRKRVPAGRGAST
ncbi:hypothetical protein ACUN0C_15200 [Faunimonas sp. B44]